MNSIQHTINEWTTTFVENQSFSSEINRKIAESLSNRGIVEILELPKGIRITSKSYVGRVDLGDFTLNIIPKLPNLPLLQLLLYTYGLRDIRLYGNTQYSTDHLGFFDLLVLSLYSYVEELINRGFSKGYLLREEELSYVRGRINIQRLASQGREVMATLPCRYYQREEDTLLNRVLLAGLRLAQQLATDFKLKHDLRRTTDHLAYFISEFKLNRHVLTSARRSINRLTKCYAPVIEIVALLYEAQATQIDDAGQTVALPGYFFDMNLFFEKLLSSLLKTLPEEYAVIDQYRIKKMFAYESLHNPQQRKPPTSRPDFALTKNGRLIRLLDAKYRDLWEHKLPSSMLYQMAAYAMSGLGGNEAVILYPAISDIPDTQIINIQHLLYDRQIGKVHLRPINLVKIADLIADGDQDKISHYMHNVVIFQ